MKPENLSELLRTVMRDNPRASEAEARQLCWRRCQGNAELIQSLFDYWFGNSYRDFKVISGSAFSSAVIAIKRERRAGTREAINKLKDKMVACLMDHMLSDGTPLRFGTFGRAARDGGWLSDIGKLGKANEVIGKKLTEADLQNIRQRHYARNSKVA